MSPRIKTLTVLLLSISALLLLGPPANAATPQSIAQSYARARVSATQFRCLKPMWTRESNWWYKARNPSSGAYGIPQAYPASKMRSAGADWRTNYRTQIRWGLSYIKSRYGSPCRAWSFWQRHHWY